MCEANDELMIEIFLNFGFKHVFFALMLNGSPLFSPEITPLLAQAFKVHGAVLFLTGIERDPKYDKLGAL